MKDYRYIVNGHNFLFQNEFINCRDGFSHESILFMDGTEIGRSRVHYINRTWERFDGETAMRIALDNAKAARLGDIRDWSMKCTGFKALRGKAKEVFDLKVSEDPIVSVLEKIRSEVKYEH